MSYKIIRFYQDLDRPNETVREGLTLDQAQAHCNDPQTSSRSCTSEEGIERTQLRGDWFHGYTAEE